MTRREKRCGWVDRLRGPSEGGWAASPSSWSRWNQCKQGGRARGRQDRLTWLKDVVSSAQVFTPPNLRSGFKEPYLWGVPGGPMVRTRCSHCQKPCSGNQDPTSCMAWPKEEEKNCLFYKWRKWVTGLESTSSLWEAASHRVRGASSVILKRCNCPSTHPEQSLCAKQVHTETKRCCLSCFDTFTNNVYIGVFLLTVDCWLSSDSGFPPVVWGSSGLEPFLP